MSLRALPVAIVAVLTAATVSAAAPADPSSRWTRERMLAAHHLTSAAPPQPRPWPGGGLVSTTVGRVFFTMGGRDFTCTATSVTSANRDTVATAGHCVNEGPGRYAKNWTFVPGYRNGHAPYGTWTARRLFAPDGWVARGDLDLDVGFAVLNPNRGRHLSDVVGAQRIGFTRPRPATADVFGLPDAARPALERLLACSGRTTADRRGTTDLGLVCPLGDGASGGPWFAGFDPRTGRGTVVSVTSFSYSETPDLLWGAYFGTTARAVYDRAQRA